MSIKKQVLENEDYQRRLNARLRASKKAVEGLPTFAQFVESLHRRPAKPRKEKIEVVRTFHNPDPIPAPKRGYPKVTVTSLVEVDGKRKLVLPPLPTVNPKRVKKETPVPLDFKELMSLPRLERRAHLSRVLGVKDSELFETLLDKRRIIRRDSEDEPRPFTVMYWGFQNKKLVGPLPTRKEVEEKGCPFVYESAIDRHWMVKDRYRGKVPYPLMSLGYEKWMLLQLPRHTDEVSPCIWQNGKHLKTDERVEKILASFVKQISFKFGVEGTMELPIRNGSKVSLAIVDGDNVPFEKGKKLEDLPFGTRLKNRLGVTLLEGDNTEKRAKMFLRSYDADGEIPVEKLKLILLDRVAWPVREVTDDRIARETDVHKVVILKIQQVLWNNGYRWWRWSTSKQKRLEKALDGVILVSSTLRELSVERMLERQLELGIDPSLIRKCAKTKQMSFRALIPGSGQLKGMAQVVDWLPWGYVLTHSCNIKREVSVAHALPDGTPVPFRYFWDAFGGKGTTRTNTQAMAANGFLFPIPTLKSWFERMKRRHLEKLATKGIVDDYDETFDFFQGEDEEVYNHFNVSARLMATELDNLGFDVREFPKIVAAASTASTSTWVKRDTAKLRIEIPGAVHYQLISQTAMMLVDPETPMIERPNKGIRFHAGHRVAYQHDALYEKSMIDHGGADGDDYYDFIVRRWGSRIVVFRLRSPSRPSEWGMDELEGHPPVDVSEMDIETVPEEVRKAVNREWKKRAHLLPALPKLDPPFVKKDGPEKKSYPVKLECPVALPDTRTYSWERYLDTLSMTSTNPGLLVNLVALTWVDRDWYLNNAPCGMEDIIDFCTKDAAKHGTVGLEWLQNHIISWWMDWFNGRLAMVDGDLLATKLDFSLFLRKGAIGVIKKQLGREIASDAQKLASLDPRPKHFKFTNLLEGMAKDLREFQEGIKRGAVEEFLKLSTRPFSDNTPLLNPTPTHREYVTLYSKYAAGHWIDEKWGKKTVSYLKEAIEKVGRKPLDLPFKDLEIFEEVQNGKYTNFKWKQSHVRDGLETPTGRVPLAQKVYRKGLRLISGKVMDHLKGEQSGEYFGAALKYCLSTYSWDPKKGARIEDFLIDNEEVWNRWLVWVILNVERTPPLLEVRYPALTHKTPSPVRKYTYTFKFDTFLPRDKTWKSRVRTMEVGDMKELKVLCEQAIAWITNEETMFVSVTNRKGERIEVQDLIKKLS